MDEKSVKEQAENLAANYPFSSDEFYTKFKKVNGYGVPFVQYGYQFFQDFLDDLPNVEPLVIKQKKYYKFKSECRETPDDPPPQPLLPQDEASNQNDSLPKSRFVSRVADLVRKCGRELTLDALNTVYLSHFGVQMVHHAKALFAIHSFADYAEFFKDELTLDEIPIYKHPALLLFRLREVHTVKDEEKESEDAVEVVDINQNRTVYNDAGGIEKTVESNADSQIIESNRHGLAEENAATPHPVSEDVTQRSYETDGSSTSESNEMVTSPEVIAQQRMKGGTKIVANEDEMDQNEGEQTEVAEAPAKELPDNEDRCDMGEMEDATIIHPNQCEMESPASPDILSAADNAMRCESGDWEESSDDMHRLLEEMETDDNGNNSWQRSPMRKRLLSDSSDAGVETKRERLFPSDGKNDETSQMVSFWGTAVPKGRAAKKEVSPKENEQDRRVERRLQIKSGKALEKIKKVLVGNRGVATLNEMFAMFQQRYSEDFNSCLGDLEGEHMYEIDHIECNDWFFRLRHIFDKRAPPVSSPFLPSSGQKPPPPPNSLPRDGVSMIVAALRECGGFATLDRMKNVFESRFGVVFFARWLREHFGTDDLMKINSHPGLSSKITICVSAQTFKFVLTASERIDCGVSQMKKVLEECGGAATWCEMQEKLQKRQISFDSSWLEFIFEKKAVDDLRNVPEFNQEIELIANPQYILRLAAPKTSETTSSSDVPLPATNSSPECISATGKSTVKVPPLPHALEPIKVPVDARREQLKALFDEFDGECTLGELREAHARIFRHKKRNKLKKSMFEDTSFLTSILGLQLIVDSSTKGPDTKLSFICKEFEGRRRMLRVLTELDGAANVAELEAGYQKVFDTTLADEMWKYFGEASPTEITEKLGKKMLTHHKNKQLYFLLKPDLKDFKNMFEAYKREIVGHQLHTPQEIFSHQCTLITGLIDAAATRIPTYANLETISDYFAGLPNQNYQELARFMRECPRRLFELMLPRKFAGLAVVRVSQKK